MSLAALGPRMDVSRSIEEIEETSYPRPARVAAVIIVPPITATVIIVSSIAAVVIIVIIADIPAPACPI
jgi:hypothetical protein